VSLVEYSGKRAYAYGLGRALPGTAIQTWVDIAAHHFQEGPEPLLDLGAGTGRFLRHLAHGLKTTVIGIEPAEDMRGQAVELLCRHTAVVAGTADRLPFASAAFRGAWISQVLHHITDLEACTRELRRILVDRGRVLVRGLYDDLHSQWPLVRYFPSLAVVADRFSSLQEMRRAFAVAGFHELAHEKVEQVTAETGAEFYERTALRAYSGLALISDREFKTGLDLLRREIENHALPAPVTEVLDLVVFG
jgi:ubiquinone/menaquinone biosynthesis C-methylase UbiE